MKLLVGRCLLIGCVAACSTSTPSGDRHSQNLVRNGQAKGELTNTQKVIPLEPRNVHVVTLHPVDEGTANQSFRDFRAKLLGAARRRDVKFVLSVLDQHILNSLGGGGGIAEFKEQWMIDKSGSPFWSKLMAVLSLGGTFRKENGVEVFCAPYVSSTWHTIVDEIPEGPEVSQYAAIIKQGVDVREGPNSNSDILSSLSYDIVKVNYQDLGLDRAPKESEWVRIITLDGKEGFVSAEAVRSPHDYHACFQKSGGKWVMTIFAAGD